jgi:hypothetical protein
MGWRDKLWGAVSKTRSEPTDSLLHGAFIDKTTLERIGRTGITRWISEASGPGGEMGEENHPQAWSAGRELATARYADRIRNFDPVPKTDAELVEVASGEVTALQTAIITYLRFEVNAGRFAADTLDKDALGTCCMSYGSTLVKLFQEHNR